ncbi:MAG: SBBP repeat-containing protein [Polyangiaceae bacterium]
MNRWCCLLSLVASVPSVGCSSDPGDRPTTTVGVGGSASGGTGEGGDLAGGGANGSEGGTGASGSAGGSGATGGNGSGGAHVCNPGAKEVCYDGPPATVELGPCLPGVRSCAADGAAWGACEGQVLPVAEICGTGWDDDCDGAVNEEGQDCDHPWLFAYSGASFGATATNLAVGAAGDVVFTAHGEAVDFGKGPQAGPSHVVKLAGDGNFAWSWSYDGNETSMDVDAAGNVVVAGLVLGHGDLGKGPIGDGAQLYAYVSKLDAAGKLLSSEHLPISPHFSFVPVSIATDPAGDIYMAAQFHGKVTLGGVTLSSAGSYDWFLAKLDADLKVQWVKQVGGVDASLSITDLDVDAAGNLFVSGMAGGALPGWGISTADVVQGFIVQLWPDASLAWSRSFGTNPKVPTVTERIDLDAQGNVVATGTFSGSVDFGGGALVAPGEVGRFLVRLDPTGGHLWSTSWTSQPRSAPLAARPHGETVFGGYLEGGSPVILDGQAFPAPTMLLGGMDEKGSLAVSQVFDMPGQPTHIAVDTDGGTILAGMFTGAIDLGFGAAKSSVAGQTMFVGKLPN